MTSVLEVVPAAEAGWVALVTSSGAELQLVEAVGYADRDSMIAIRYDLKCKEEPALPVQIFTSGKAMRFGEVHRQIAKLHRVAPGFVSTMSTTAKEAPTFRSGGGPAADDRAGSGDLGSYERRLEELLQSLPQAP